MLRYEIIIFWSDEDDLYVAHIPELPGCSAHGSTYEDTLREAQVAISLWIDTASELGHPIPKPAGALVGPSA